MSFDAVFDQPEIIADLDDLTFDVVTYSAVAARTGSTWTVTAGDLPGGRVVQAEGRTWIEAEDKIHGSATEHLGVDPTTVIVSVEPAEPSASAALYALTGARIARAKAEQAERDAARHAAGLLVGQGWSVRDVGQALRLPVARISGLTTDGSCEAVQRG